MIKSEIHYENPDMEVIVYNHEVDTIIASVGDSGNIKFDDIVNPEEDFQ